MMTEAKTGSERLRIGFVGLGVMGEPMAGHLAKAGHAVRVLDADPSRLAAAFAATPALVAATSPAELGAFADVLITMLPNGDIVRDVVVGDDETPGLGASLRAGAIVVDTSSSEPWITRRTSAWLAGRGVRFVDAPVSGAQWGAQAADLVFMVGAEDDDLARVRPLLERMGRAVFHVGPPGAGHTMKCINNLITAVTFIGTAEGLIIGKRCGLDPEAMNAVLNESTGGSWLTRSHFAQRVFNRRFDDPFRLELMTKDVNIALGLAAEHQLPLPLSALGQQLYRAASQAKGPGSSVSEMVRWVEELTATALTAGRDGAGATALGAGGR
jgi:3-hydroxyisobutyrate dehydrogenase